MNPDDDVDMQFQAALDQLRAQVGPARLEEAQRREIGEQMLEQALNAALATNDPPLWRRDPSVVMWMKAAEPNWGWDENNE
jgi:hypothetical protein